MLYLFWYISGLAIVGLFYYKIENSINIIEFIGVLVVSLLGPFMLVLPVLYFLDNYGDRIFLKW